MENQAKPNRCIALHDSEHRCGENWVKPISEVQIAEYYTVVYRLALEWKVLGQGARKWRRKVNKW